MNWLSNLFRFLSGLLESCLEGWLYEGPLHCRHQQRHHYKNSCQNVNEEKILHERPYWRSFLLEKHPCWSISHPRIESADQQHQEVGSNVKDQLSTRKLTTSENFDNDVDQTGQHAPIDQEECFEIDDGCDEGLPPERVLKKHVQIVGVDI